MGGGGGKKFFFVQFGGVGGFLGKRCRGAWGAGGVGVGGFWGSGKLDWEMGGGVRS